MGEVISVQIITHAQFIQIWQVFDQFQAENSILVVNDNTRDAIGSIWNIASINLMQAIKGNI